MKTEDIIDRIPFELLAAVVCDEMFDDVPVVPADSGNIAAEIERASAVITEKNGRRGVCVIVMQIVADEDPRFEEVQGPMILRPKFLVIENVEINNDDNGTRKSHRKIARRLVKIIKGFQMDGFIQSVKMDRPGIEPADLDALGPNAKGSWVNFHCSERISEKQEYCAPPRISGSGTAPENAVVELTCETPGAEIWFTLDGLPVFNGDQDKYPGSTAQRYTGAISIPAEGLMLRARAFAVGKIGSGVIKREIKYSF